MKFEINQRNALKDESYVLLITLKDEELPNLLIANGQIDLDLTPEELIELAQECHQITRPGYIYCHYKDEIKELKKINKELEQKIDGSMDTSLILMSQKDELNKKILDLKEENKDLAEKIVPSLEEKILDLQEENSKLNKRIEGYSKFEKKLLSEVEEMVVLREVNIKLADKNTKLEKKVRDLSNAISFLKTKTKKLEVLNSGLTDDNADFIIKIDDLEEKVRLLRYENEELDEYNDDLIIDKIKLEKKVNELTDIKNGLECRNDFLEEKWSKSESKLFLIEKSIKDSDLDSCEKLTEIKSLFKN